MPQKILKRVSGNGNGKAGVKPEARQRGTNGRQAKNGQRPATSMVIVELNGGAGLW